MPKIAHLSDIHVRGSSRLDEYKEVFERCFAQLAVQKPDLIFIGGDIVHSKTQGITPELIDFLTWWFRNLAEIAPTHVILGNHDGILSNEDRQDAISPILTAIADPRITLYKKSGVYPMGIPGFNWCVFSCFDEHGWKSIRPVPDEINIATFHGAVWGSLTDIDWKIEGEIDVFYFDDFDFTLMGDIHRQQFLNWRIASDGVRKPFVGYSGSVIQQNHGESIEKGYLLWDIRSREDFDVEFHTVQGANPFVTVDWKGTVQDTIDSCKFLPERARIRVKSQAPIPSVEWKHISSEFVDRLSACEVVSQSDRDFDVRKITANEVELSKEDLRDPETQHRLLRDFFKNSPITESDWTEIELIVDRHMNSLSKTDDFSRGKNWSLRRLEFDNTFAYGEGNVIDFEKRSGITGIFGRNAIGKSSIMGTLMYALFNASDRGSIRNIDIVNTRKSHCLTKATVTVDGERYRLERQTAKHKERDGSEGALTNLNVFRVDEDGSVLSDHSGEQRKDTDKILRKKMGLADDFLLTSFASQGEMNTFVRQKNTARKAILTRILGLDIFDQLYNLVKDDAKVVQGQMKSFPNQNWDRTILDKLTEVETHEQCLSLLEKEAHTIREEESALKLELSGIASDLVTKDDVLKQQNYIHSLEKNNSELLKTRQTESDALVELAKKQGKIDQLKNSISIDDLRERLTTVRTIEKKKVETKHMIEREKTTLKHQQKSVEKLSEVPCGDLFPTCKFISESHACKSKIVDQQRIVDDLIRQLVEMDEHSQEDNSEAIEEKIRKYETILRNESDIKASTTVKTAKISQLIADIEKCQRKIEDAKVTLASLEQKVVSSALGDDVSQKRKLLEKKSERLKHIDRDRLDRAGKIGSCKTAVENLNKEKERYEIVKHQWRIYELLLEAFSKRGIPVQIIMSQLPIINHEIEKILQGVTSFGVTLEADSDSNDLDVFIDYGDSRRAIEVGSGMEKMIASLAIRVALINVSSLPKTDMLIVDEGFGTLDDVNVEACTRLLHSLKKWFRNILIITHIDSIKDVVDNVIEIGRNGVDSIVVSR